MNFPGFVLAYHGCDRAVGERILLGREQVRASANDYDWLGSGAYFWENNPRRALEWANFLRDHPQYAQGPVTKPFVIGAIIQPGWTLDLMEANCLGILKDAYEDLAGAMADSGADLPQNERAHSRDIDFVKRKLDCAVINYVHLMREWNHRQPFDCVRGAFFEGGSLYPGAGVAAKAHIQWCVRNPVRNIRGYFVPLPGWEE
jgi:hypothetical protein